MSRRLDARARRPRCCLFHGAFIASVLFLSLSLSVSLFRARKLFTHVRSSGSPYSKERERKIEKERERERECLLSPFRSFSLSLRSVELLLNIISLLSLPFYFRSFVYTSLRHSIYIYMHRETKQKKKHTHTYTIIIIQREKEREWESERERERRWGRKRSELNLARPNL